MPFRAPGPPGALLGWILWCAEKGLQVLFCVLSDPSYRIHVFFCVLSDPAYRIHVFFCVLSDPSYRIHVFFCVLSDWWALQGTLVETPENLKKIGARILSYF